MSGVRLDEVVERAHADDALLGGDDPVRSPSGPGRTGCRWPPPSRPPPARPSRPGTRRQRPQPTPFSRSSATSVERVAAHHLGGELAAVRQRAPGSAAPSTTWLLVTTRPSGVRTKPEPVAFFVAPEPALTRRHGGDVDHARLHRADQRRQRGGGHEVRAGPCRPGRAPATAPAAPRRPVPGGLGGEPGGVLAHPRLEPWVERTLVGTRHGGERQHEEDGEAVGRARRRQLNGGPWRAGPTAAPAASLPGLERLSPSGLGRGHVLGHLHPGGADDAVLEPVARAHLGDDLLVLVRAWW